MLHAAGAIFAFGLVIVCIILIASEIWRPVLFVIGCALLFYYFARGLWWLDRNVGAWAVPLGLMAPGVAAIVLHYRARRQAVGPDTSTRRR